MLGLIVRFVVSLLCSHANLAAENIALRHQPLVLQRTAGKVNLKQPDRILWA